MGLVSSTPKKTEVVVDKRPWDEKENERLSKLGDEADVNQVRKRYDLLRERCLQFDFYRSDDYMKYMNDKLSERVGLQVLIVKEWKMDESTLGSMTIEERNNYSKWTFPGSGYVLVADTVKRNQDMIYFQMNEMYFTSRITDMFIQAMAGHLCLEEIDLFDCDLTDEMAIKIVKALVHNQPLKKINMGGNVISADGRNMITDFLEQHHSKVRIKFL